MLKLLGNTCLLLFLCLETSLNSLWAQSVLDPADSVITYDSTAAPPVQPPNGQIGKWVRTKRLTWNTDNFKAYIYEGMPFRLHFPKTYDPKANDGKKYPMIVFFHGLGEADTSIYDNEYQLKLGHKLFDLEINAGVYDGYTLSIQSGGSFGITEFTKIKEIIDYMIANNKLDPFHIVTNGLSAGGQGTWEMMINFPTYIAAALPMSWSSISYTDQSIVDKVKYKPIWDFQGGQDGSPAPYTTTQVLNAINGAGGDMKETVYPTMAHNTWDSAWAEPDFFPFVNRAYASNPWPYKGRSIFFPGETINTTIGLTSGYDAYEWRKDSVMISGANSNVLTVTQTGTYDARVMKNGVWSDWSHIPVVIKVSTPVPIPGKIEAENYDNMLGVIPEVTTDSAGGKDVGNIDKEEWMDYSIDVASAGTYTASFRVATPKTRATLELLNSDGTVLAVVNVPVTGGWQNWTTVYAKIDLPAGKQIIRVASCNYGKWNINWFKIDNSAVTSYVDIPSKIEAENWAAMSGVQTEPTSDTGAGLDVGWIDPGDWLDYNLNAKTAGVYKLSLRLATPNNNGQLQLRKSDGTVLTTVNIPNTGGYQSWQTVDTTITLAAGQQTLRLISTGTDLWNINWLQFSLVPVYPSLPAKIEAESFDAMSGVVPETTSDTGGGQDIGNIDQGDWLDYNVTVPSPSTFTVQFRVATPKVNASFELRKSDGTVLATLAVPTTGGYQTWQTITAKVDLPAGDQTLRIVSTNTSRWNFNWMQFDTAATTVPVTYQSLPAKVEAESYAAMTGVVPETTTDIGGGLDVGNIDLGDWMDYNVTVPAAGTFAVSFRLATPKVGATFQLRKADGTVLASVNVPTTGGYQMWQTITTNVVLPAGDQTLRIVSTSSNRWNINWMQFDATATAGAAAPTSLIMERELSGPASVTIYPNPVQDQFMLTVNNQMSGSMKVQVLNMNGALQKEVTVNKQTGLSENNISLSGLQKGMYLLSIQMNGWKETRKIMKL